MKATVGDVALLVQVKPWTETQGFRPETSLHARFRSNASATSIWVWGLICTFFWVQF